LFAPNKGYLCVELLCAFFLYTFSRCWWVCVEVVAGEMFVNKKYLLSLIFLSLIDTAGTVLVGLVNGVPELKFILLILPIFNREVVIVTNFRAILNINDRVLGTILGIDYKITAINCVFSFADGTRSFRLL
jgi:hypothetical protein